MAGSSHAADDIDGLRFGHFQKQFFGCSINGGDARVGGRLKPTAVDILVDTSTREALAIDVGQESKGEQVVEAMARISSIRRAPRTIRVDNRPEFISKALDR